MKAFMLVVVLLAVSWLGCPAVARGSEPGEPPASVSNVRYNILGDSVIVTYDLKGSPEDEYAVSLELRSDADPGFFFRPRVVSGDAGKGRFAGSGRRIVWNVKEEFPAGLPGNDYYFVVDAAPLSTGISPFVWIATGAAVTAGAAAIILSPKKTTPAATQSQFPPPPGRP